MKFEIISLESTTSTNDWMHKMYLDGRCFDGLVIQTDHQTQGKGLQANSWFSSPAANLLCSIGLETGFIGAENQFVLTKMISVTLLRSLRNLLTLTDELTIKWPNDLYYHHKKLAGVLVTNMVQGNMLDYSIVGIGLNVNEMRFPVDLPNPVSMAQIGHQTYDREKVLEVLLNQLLQAKNLLQLERTALDAEYLTNLLYYQQWREYIYEDKPIKGMIHGVNRFGHLLVKTDSGEQLSCDLKSLVFKH